MYDASLSVLSLREDQTLSGLNRAPSIGFKYYVATQAETDGGSSFGGGETTLLRDFVIYPALKVEEFGIFQKVKLKVSLATEIKKETYYKETKDKITEKYGDSETS